jgi:Tol biopolymer transport system component
MSRTHWPATSLLHGRPTGRKILFVSNGDGNGEVYVMNADGSGLRKLTNLKGQN